MGLDIKPMRIKEAEEICHWTYSNDYSIYSFDSSEEMVAELADGSYYVAKDESGAVIGYFCFGASAQVPAGNAVGAYRDSNYLDTGLGMRPDLCGKGRGIHFLKQGLGYARNSFGSSVFRLTVASFNKRAILVYERAGFQETMRFVREMQDKSQEFIVMTLSGDI